MSKAAEQKAKVNAALGSPVSLSDGAWPALNILQGRLLSVKMNYRIALRFRDKAPLLWCCPEVLNQWVSDRKRMHVYSCFWVTLSLIVLSVITRVIVGTWGGGWGFALMELKMELKRGRVWEPSLVDIDLACKVHFIIVLALRGSGVCPTSSCA